MSTAKLLSNRDIKVLNTFYWEYFSNMNREFVEEQIKSSKQFLEEQYGIERIGIFGSFARNEQQDTSDVDILIELGKPIGFEFMKIKYYLEEKLGISVDLVTKNALKPQLREQILKEVIYQ